MNQEKNRLHKPAAVAALAGLVSTLGLVAPAGAAVHDVAGKVAALRSASKTSVTGSILSRAVSQRDSVGSRVQTKYSQSYTQTYNQSYTEGIQPVQQLGQD